MSLTPVPTTRARYLTPEDEERRAAYDDYIWFELHQHRRFRARPLKAESCEAVLMVIAERTADGHIDRHIFPPEQMIVGDVGPDGRFYLRECERLTDEDLERILKQRPHSKMGGIQWWSSC